MIVTTHSVFCDGSTDQCHGWIAESRTASDARKVAKNAGWKVRGGDLCPACQKTA